MNWPISAAICAPNEDHLLRQLKVPSKFTENVSSRYNFSCGNFVKHLMSCGWYSQHIFIWKSMWKYLILYTSLSIFDWIGSLWVLHNITNCRTFGLLSLHWQWNVCFSHNAYALFTQQTHRHRERDRRTERGKTISLKNIGTPANCTT